MDVYCPKCGEPCDNGEFLYMEENWGRDLSPDEAREVFFTEGCGSLFSDGERSCLSVRDKLKAKWNERKKEHKLYVEFFKEHQEAGEEDVLMHPVTGLPMMKEDIRCERWSIEWEMADLESRLFKASASEALYDLMGDDFDGIASLSDEFDF
jgi:hypothetical protein